ncbi:class I SAM-dependent methyltransferase [Winogradskyella sp. R77965]|uniref:class I SAM-dependent methyltransferase n=1 Tax=Winogradskyella sp. R77965 TaxID=3093872 RepID=UPI0037DC9C14
MKIQLHSPLITGGLVHKIEVFKASKICLAYKEMGIDVSRFFDKLENVELLECEGTGYRFYYPFSTIGDAGFYKDLSTIRKDYYSIRWEHLKILPSLAKNENVLEIGSGFGAFLKLLKSNEITAEGIELNPEAINVCKKQNLTIHNELIEDFAIKHKEHYDVVCFFQVLEHITNVHDFIENALLTLKPNGKLIIGVPNNNPFLYVNDKYHTLNLPPHHAGLWNNKAFKSLESIFDVQLTSLQYEPLEKTYSQFLRAYIRNSNFIYSKILRIANKIVPKVLKFILCKYIDGRNILVVFTKVR